MEQEKERALAAVRQGILIKLFPKMRYQRQLKKIVMYATGENVFGSVIRKYKYHNFLEILLF
jgi:hypothetical protein